MLEALWSVEFVSNVQDFGAGVVVLETGRLLGGDASFTYIGTYKANAGVVIADIEVTNFRGEPNSVFGNIPKFSLHGEGQIKYDTFDMLGFMVEKPEMKIAIRFTRRAELPNP